jgi:hypothetical protein
MSVILGNQPPHQCSPPRHRPESEWEHVGVPERLRAPAGPKTMPIPTPYPIGTIWTCSTCDRSWHAVQWPTMDGRGGYSGGHTDNRWVPVRWWDRTLRKRIIAAQPIGTEIGGE